jgi:hypothetical protein
MARLLHLEAQGLLTLPRRAARPADVAAAIRRMALLQIDSINVVARSPYLVLFSRLGPYPTAWLDDCLARGDVYEYWAHEACFIPRADYGLLRRRMLDPAGMGWKDPSHWLDTHRDDIAELLAHIRDHGPVRAADFERRDGKGGGWWDWKPEKRHLEALFSSGQLMVARRHHFQRVYDLAERVRPDWNDARDLPAPETAMASLIENSCRALGIATARWVADYYRLRRGDYRRQLHALADAGRLIPVGIDGWSEDAFVHCDLAATLERAAAGTLRSRVTRLLSPFDPVVWDRQRARELFDFDYRIECYTPAEKRRYGYFVLPVLHGGRLVGRLDAKAHRAQGVFEVKALYLEPGVRPSASLGTALGRALGELADWHGTPRLAFGTLPDGLAPHLGAHD